MSGSGRKHYSKRDFRDDSELARRSRSRSPECEKRLDSGADDRKRMRTGGSTRTCRDFAAGTCRKGSHCHFLHDDQNYEDGRESRHRQDGSPRYYAHRESADYSRRRGRSKEPCIHFAKGNCRNGASCKYAHLDTSDRFDRRRMENSYDHGDGHGPNHSSDTPCRFFTLGSCRNGNRCRFSHATQAPKSFDRRRDDRLRSDQDEDQALEIPKLNDSSSLNGRLNDDRRGSDRNMADVNEVWDGAKQKDFAAVFSTAKLVEDDKMGAPGFVGLTMNDGWDHGLDKNRIGVESSFLGKKETNRWEAENARAIMCGPPQSISTGIWPGDEQMSPDWKYGVGSALLVEEKHVQNQQQAAPGQGYNQNALHPSGGQVAIPIVPPRVGMVEGMQNQEISNEKSLLKNLSQVGSRNPSNQNAVSQEQLAHLTSISVSLAHILGSVQQLPQLQASLSSRDAKTEAGSIPVFPTFVKSDPVVGLQDQYDPMTDSIERKNANASGVPPLFSPIKTLTGGVVEGEIIEVNKGKGVVVAEGKQGSQTANGITKDTKSPLQNGGTDEAKKTKDVKGIRAFKYSLVEFVKELLKPTWKEGKITKEDYKSIVKKVADKVTGTLQRAHIPQTQEKIDHYLSLSKPKLSKLLQVSGGSLTNSDYMYEAFQILAPISFSFIRSMNLCATPEILGSFTTMKLRP